MTSHAQYVTLTYAVNLRKYFDLQAPIEDILRAHKLLSETLELLLLLDLEQESTVDVWQDTTESNSGADQGVKLLVTANGKLQMTWGDTLDLEVLGSILITKVS